MPAQVTPVPAPEPTEPAPVILPAAQAPLKKKRQVFIISKGQRNIPLPVEEIAYFYTKDEHNYLRTFANETFLVDESLEDIFSNVDEQLFFRANRQTIINFNACSYFSYLEHGKLQVALQPGTDEPVIISQKRSPLFKEWVRR
jgi:DNA-binding LytR/AlgR family response regulator